MQISRLIIEKFLSGQCSHKEAEEIAHYLRRHPEVLMEQTEEDWNATDVSFDLTSDESYAMYHSIEEYLDKKSMVRQLFIRRLSGVAVAALLIGFMVGLYLFFMPKSSNHSRVALHEAKVMTPQNGWVECLNLSKEKEVVDLPDHSVAVLFRGARLKYRRDFLRERLLFLEGKAFFRVRKKVNKPFCVHTNLLSTTVLGTSFCVDCRSRGIRIQIFSGKVFIRPERKGLKGWLRNCYLVRGQWVNYAAGHQYVFSGSPFSNKATEQPVLQALPKRMEVVSETNDLLFNDEPIDLVLEKLQDFYHVPVDFIKEDLGNLRFSGTIKRTDSIGLALRLIGEMNGLNIEVIPNGYKVRKNEHIIK